MSNQSKSVKSKNKSLLFVCYLLPSLLITGCDISNVGENEDSIPPVVTILSPAVDETIDGTYDITWNTDEANKSRVDIALSDDSGANYIVIAKDIPDIGSYPWDSYANNPFERKDGDAFRVQVTATDVVGNVSQSASSMENFTINNIAEVSGARFYDYYSDGPDLNDELVISFDRVVEVRSSGVRDFVLPVEGDSLGPNARIEPGDKSNEAKITLQEISGAHIKVVGIFDEYDTRITAPSGIDLVDNISSGVIFSPDNLINADNSEYKDIQPGFTAGDNLSGGVTVDLAAADYDQDGDDDILVVNASTLPGGDSFVLRNDNGIFTRVNLPLPNTRSNETSTGTFLDIDGDQDLDIVIAYPDVDDASVVFRNNAGVFVDVGISIDAAYKTHAVDVIDIDADNDIDIIVGNSEGPTRIYRNPGNGLFYSDGSNYGNNNTKSLAVGDIDGDGDADFVEGNAEQADQIWINNDGFGSFVEGQVLNGTDTIDIALIDLDNDGDLDIYSADRAGVNMVWLNQGKGLFSPDTRRDQTATQTTSIIAVDLDQDGDTDIVEGITSALSRVLLNDGSGVLIDNGERFGNSRTTALAPADIDKDGDKDIVEGAFDKLLGTWHNSLLFNSVGHRFVDSMQELDDDNSSSVAMADIDRDGDLDVAFGNTFGQPNRIWINNGKGIFTASQQSLGTGNTTSIGFADLNKDTYPDLVAGNSGESTTIWWNDGAGTFTQDFAQKFGDSSTESIALADMNNDTYTDIVEGIFGSIFGSTTLWLNNGSGVFSNSGYSLGTANTQAIRVAHLNGDNMLDIVEGNSFYPDYIYLNSGAGFTAYEINLNDGGDRTRSIVSGDMDGNGTSDIIKGRVDGLLYPSPLPEINMLYLNNGEASFTYSSNSGFEGNDATTLALETADLDGDGDLDVVEGNYNESNVIWLNNGSGIFNKATMLTSDYWTQGLALGDLDNDGDLDLVEANKSQPNRIYYNDRR